MAFEAAIFTDVTADESVTGFDGFQFQSVSPGFDGEDMAVVQGELNFVPTPTWGSAHGGDEGSHPQQHSFAVRNGRMYLTKSHSLGLTTNGRPGNQLTEVATTSTTDDLVPYTPAQLMTATAWTQAKSPAKTREPWMTPLQIDAGFEADELERFVRADPWALSVLPSFVTMLRRALDEDGCRVFIQHTDLTEVLRWIALGSLLLDSESAAQLTFRAFHAQPWNGPFKVVGVHPELLALSTPAEWRNSPSALWIDLGARTISQITPSALAASSVGWLTEHGVFEAMGATQLATELQPTLGADLAVRTADLVTFGSTAIAARDAWDLASRSLTALAAADRRDLVESSADELLDALVSYRPRGAAEFAQAADTVAALLNSALPRVASGVIEPTLEALAGAPEFAAVFAAPIANASRSMEWHDAEARQLAASAWATALNGAPESELSTLFGATKSLNLDLDSALLLPAVERLADQWAADPSLGAQSAAWYASSLVQEAVAEKVEAALERGDAVQTQALLRGEWSTLTASANSPLSGWLRVPDVTSAPAADRAARLGALVPGSIPNGSWRVILGEIDLPSQIGRVCAFVRVAGIRDDLALAIATSVEREIRASTVATVDGGAARWSQLFDLLIEVGSAGVRLVPPLPEQLAVVASARRTREAARSELGSAESAALLGSGPHARIWAMEDLVTTGQLLVTALDRRGAAVLARSLGGASRQSMDAYLDLVTAGREGAEAGRVALEAYENSAGPLRDDLGFAASRLLDKHRDIERALKKDEPFATLVAEVRELYPVDAHKSWRSPGSWFSRGEK